MTRNLLLTFTILVFICGCKKDEPTVNYVPSSTEVKYKITLSHDTIVEYSQFINNQLTSTKYFYFNGATDEIITKNASGIMTGKSVYQIGSSGYAESSIDSSFSDSGTVSISVSTYEYQNGFLTRHSVDTGKYVYTRSISDDNIVSSNVSFPSYQSGCTDYYSYNGFPTIAHQTTIDVTYFSNKIFGKPNKNLITHASWSNGCPCGPSSNPASSNFQYEFNSSGYVTQMKNYYTPCYHTETESVSGTVSTATYEYY
jgi:hypothetical protein